MSLLDGKVVLAGERVNNNGGNRRERRNNNRNDNDGSQNRWSNKNDNQQRNYSTSAYNYIGSSYLTDEMRAEMENDDGIDRNPQPQKEVKNDPRAKAIFDFVDEFSDNTDNFRALQDIMIDRFPDAVRHIRAYYSQKNSPQFNDAANKLVKLSTTSYFSKTLKKVLEGNFWVDDEGTYGKIWRSIGFLLSTALETNYNRMHGDVVRLYATEILPRMWNAEITDISSKTGVTRDLVLDLAIAIPMVGSEWNAANIDAFYPRFLDKMLVHAEDNMDVLNWEVQGMLYDEFFGKNNTGVKVIGKYLVSHPKEEKDLDGEVLKRVYQDFVKMLYSKLDTQDIDKIAYVFKFVGNWKKEHDGEPTIFNAEDASKFENVRKGLLVAMDDREIMSHLA